MNYIWELSIKAKNINIDEDNIFYKFGRPFSAYMELSFENMNQNDILHEVEINPYYRYYRIFKNLFNPNINENTELIEITHDLAIHHLKDIDVLMGMSKREYYIKFIIDDMKNGLFGQCIKDKIGFFSKEEQKILGNNILNLFLTGEGIYLLKNTMRKIFTNTYIFSNASEKDEIVFFLRTERTKEREEKLELIKYLFLPFKCIVEVYWEHIFGIIGIDELMKIDKIMNY